MHLFALEMQSTGHNPKSSDAQLVPPIRIQWSYFRAPEFYLEENPADIEVPLHNFTYYFDFENSFCCHFIYYPKSFLGLKSFCKDQPAGKRISYLATATHRSAMPDGFYRAYIYIYSSCFCNNISLFWHPPPPSPLLQYHSAGNQRREIRTTVLFKFTACYIVNEA